jgi:hypothetical protein
MPPDHQRDSQRPRGLFRMSSRGFLIILAAMFAAAVVLRLTKLELPVPRVPAGNDAALSNTPVPLGGAQGNCSRGHPLGGAAVCHRILRADHDYRRRNRISAGDEHLGFVRISGSRKGVPFPQCGNGVENMVDSGHSRIPVVHTPSENSVFRQFPGT